MPPFTFNNPEHKELRRKLRRDPSLGEKVLWQYLCNRQFHGLKFRRQHGIGKYVVDFYCAEAKVAVEVDGDFHAEPTAVAYDRERDSYIRQHGVRVIRFIAIDVIGNTDDVLNTLQKELKRYTYLPRLYD